MCRKKPYFPMFVDISEKRIVVIGGGKVAERRVDTLLKFADDITVVSPEVSEGIRQKAKEKKIRWIPEAFCADEGERKAKEGRLSGNGKDFLAGADMVIAATSDSACNELVMRICRKRKIPVNVSHKKELCDFYFPAAVVKDNVTVGITSGGQSHAQARKIREQVETALE